MQPYYQFSNSNSSLYKKNKMYSRNLFGMQTSEMTRTLIEPLGKSSASNSGTILSLLTFTTEVVNAIRAIQQEYTFHLSNKDYTLIPTNYERYLELYDVVEQSINLTSYNPDLQTLFIITKEALRGTIYVYDLYVRNLRLRVQNDNLQRQVDNTNTRIGLESSGSLCLTRSFTLAPIFSYYILVYGMPSQGQGFDETKLNLLVPILEENNIDPYG